MKHTLANKKARQRIAEISKEEYLTTCELKDEMERLGFKGCKGSFGIAPAHRHSRNWYKGDWELLADRNQWVAACQWCHQILDDRSKISEEQAEEIFNNIKGQSKLNTGEDEIVYEPMY